METTIENPVLHDDPELDQLRTAAEAADRGEAFELPSTERESETRAPDTTESKETSSPDTKLETKKDERPRDELGRFTKTEDGRDIPESERTSEKPVSNDDQGAAKDDAKPAGDTGAKPESAYVKAQKDQERLARNRQEFEEEKRRERDRLAQYEDQLRQREAQLQQPQQRNGQDQQPQYSSREYAKFAADCTRNAKKLRESGDYEAADEQGELAAQATQKALATRDDEDKAAQQQGFQQFQQMLEYDTAETMRIEPELRDANSDWSKETIKVLGEYGPVVDAVPLVRLANGRVVGGFSLAAEVAKLRLKAGLASGLEEENKRLKADSEKERSKTAINGSSPTSPMSAKRFEDMNDDEAEAYIRRQAEGVPIWG